MFWADQTGVGRVSQAHNVFGLMGAYNYIMGVRCSTLALGSTAWVFVGHRRCPVHLLISVITYKAEL